MKGNTLPSKEDLIRQSVPLIQKNVIAWAWIVYVTIHMASKTHIPTAIDLFLPHMGCNESEIQILTTLAKSMRTILEKHGSEAFNNQMIEILKLAFTT